MSDKQAPLRPMDDTHACASCGNLIENSRRFEGHDEQTCMQPEIRFRRMERELANTHAALLELTEFVRQMYGAAAEQNANVEALGKALEEMVGRVCHIEGFLAL